jgi:hypothetical protein
VEVAGRAATATAAVVMMGRKVLVMSLQLVAR